MKRLLLTTILGTGTRADPFRPNVPAAATAAVVLHEFPNRMLVKCVLPDGTAKTANTICDITFDTDGRQVDYNAEALTPTQIANAKTLLSNAGFNVAQFDGDGIDDRAKLLRFILRRLAQWQDMTPRELLEGWDAG